MQTKMTRKYDHNTQEKTFNIYPNNFKNREHDGNIVKPKKLDYQIDNQMIVGALFVKPSIM